MIRLIAVDLDGTLLRSDATVSARTVAALRLADRAGARVLAVTARPPRYLPALATALDPAPDAGPGGLAVCCNGALLHDLRTGSTSVLADLPLAVARQAARALTGVLPDLAFAVETGDHCLRGPGFRHVHRSDTAGDVPDEHLLWTAAGRCVKLLAWSPAPVTANMLGQVRSVLPQLTVTWSGGPGLLEIGPAGVSKVDTLARLCAQWGVRPADVVAFGDMPNDLEMLRWAGTAVAVANAHPDVLAVADRVTASNNDDGVALALEELFAARAVPG